jgi:periplasmic copper chaperone A
MKFEQTGAMNKKALGFTSFLFATTLVIGLPNAALAHITPRPAKVALGATTDVSFTIGHGCSGSSTVSVAVKLPAVVSATANPVTGWTATSADGVITYVAATPLPTKKKATFSLRVTFPKTSQLAYFPIVQTCSKGSLKWVSKNHDSELPAPVVAVGTAVIPGH